MLVLALPGAARMAGDLARELGCACSELALHRFPDGESLVRIDVPVDGQSVVLAGSLHQPDGKTLPMLFAADCARELGAARVGLCTPYLPYMRQDRRFHPGEAVSSRSYAKLLSSALDFLVTVDPHLHRWNSLRDIYPIRTQAVSAAPAIADWLRQNVAAPVLVGPDAESARWVEEVARLCEVPWTVMEKSRQGDREVTVALRDELHWQDRATPVLLDDMASTGRTLAAAAQALRAVAPRPPVCVVVHALLDADALAQVHHAGVSRLVSCDGVPHPTNQIALAPLLARAVRRFAARDALGALGALGA